MKNLKNTLVIAIILIAVSSCGGGKSSSGQQNEDGSNRRDEIRLTQYMVEGKRLYKIHCMNCHMDNGEGLAQLYPPLKNSDYLLANLPRAACIIKNGLAEEITINGKNYNQMMPANLQLTPIEIAEILTYITNSWGNDAGISSTKEVTTWLELCHQ